MPKLYYDNLHVDDEDDDEEEEDEGDDDEVVLQFSSHASVSNDAPTQCAP